MWRDFFVSRVQWKRKRVILPTMTMRNLLATIFCLMIMFPPCTQAGTSPGHRRAEHRRKRNIGASGTSAQAEHRRKRNIGASGTSAQAERSLDKNTFGLVPQLHLIGYKRITFYQATFETMRFGKPPASCMLMSSETKTDWFILSFQFAVWLLVTTFCFTFWKRRARPTQSPAT